MKIELFSNHGIQFASVDLGDLDEEEAYEIMDEVRESVRRRS